MKSRLLNTYNFRFPNIRSKSRRKVRLLINSLSKQPLIIVIRLKEEDFNDISKSSPLFLQIDYLNRSGVKHIEIAWSSDHRWPLIMEKLVQIYGDILFGAASIVSTHSLKVISELNLTYAMSPIWDINLQEEAKSLNLQSLGWRKVPVDSSVLGKLARSNAPFIEQWLITGNKSGSHFESILFRLI
mgnify:CR=1 FL=1